MTPASVEPEADLHRHLKMCNLATFDVPTHIRELEPVEVRSVSDAFATAPRIAASRSDADEPVISVDL